MEATGPTSSPVEARPEKPEEAGPPAEPTVAGVHLVTPSVAEISTPPDIEGGKGTLKDQLQIGTGTGDGPPLIQEGQCVPKNGHSTQTSQAGGNGIPSGGAIAIQEGGEETQSLRKEGDGIPSGGAKTNLKEEGSLEHSFGQKFLGNHQFGGDPCPNFHFCRKD